MRLQQLYMQIRMNVISEQYALTNDRAAVTAAEANEQYNQQSLDAEIKKLHLGASTTANVLQQQRNLAAADAQLIAATRPLRHGPRRSRRDPGQHPRPLRHLDRRRGNRPDQHAARHSRHRAGQAGARSDGTDPEAAVAEAGAAAATPASAAAGLSGSAAATGNCP